MHVLAQVEAAAAEAKFDLEGAKRVIATILQGRS